MCPTLATGTAHRCEVGWRATTLRQPDDTRTKHRPQYLSTMHHRGDKMLISNTSTGFPSNCISSADNGTYCCCHYCCCYSGQWFKQGRGVLSNYQHSIQILVSRELYQSFVKTVNTFWCRFHCGLRSGFQSSLQCTSRQRPRFWFHCNIVRFSTAGAHAVPQTHGRTSCPLHAHDAS